MFLEPLLIDEGDAADILAIRQSQLRRLVDRGHLPARLLPTGDRRFDPQELREWVSQLRHIEQVPA